MIDFIKLLVAIFAIAGVAVLFICVGASSMLSSRISQDLERRKEDL